MTYEEPGDTARPFRINARFAADELETVRAAAACAGLTPTRYVAEASLSLAHTHATRYLNPLRRAHGELDDAIGELRTLRAQLTHTSPSDTGSAGKARALLHQIGEVLDEMHAAAARLRTLPPLTSAPPGSTRRNRPVA